MGELAGTEEFGKETYTPSGLGVMATHEGVYVVLPAGKAWADAISKAAAEGNNSDAVQTSGDIPA